MTRNLNNWDVLAKSAWKGPPVAILWDQSLLWGLLSVETLKAFGVPFHLLSATDIIQGSLKAYRVLIVPGGWASHKLRVLTETGKHEISMFVERGGSYLGFCGGAGLALSSAASLQLVPVKRMPFNERLPNASGEVWVQKSSDHPIWQNLPDSLPVHIWWPAQFSIDSSSHAECLAVYQNAGKDFWVADLPLCDLPDPDNGFSEWEKIYGINLDPRKLMGHPAIVHSRKGRGALILSYPHLDHPGSCWGNRLFFNCLSYLDECAAEHIPSEPSSYNISPPTLEPPGEDVLHHFLSAKEAVDDLMDFGERHLLWRWRLPWLLNWQRGIRGLEYGSLAVLMDYGVTCLSSICINVSSSNDPWLPWVLELKEDIKTFCKTASVLLFEEKMASRTHNLSKLGEVNETVDRLRFQLFGRNMSHGGLCRKVFDRLDAVLLQLIRMTMGREIQPVIHPRFRASSCTWAIKH